MKYLWDAWAKEGLGLFDAIVGSICGLIKDIIRSLFPPTLRTDPPEEAQRVADLRKQESIRREREAEELRGLQKSIATTTGSRIPGRRFVAHIGVVTVSNHRNQEKAELAFLRKVKGMDANAVVRYIMMRHKGGYISIQGDAQEWNEGHPNKSTERKRNEPISCSVKKLNSNIGNDEFSTKSIR